MKTFRVRGEQMHFYEYKIIKARSATEAENLYQEMIDKKDVKIEETRSDIIAEEL